MDEILKFLLKYCRDLYNKYAFKFVDSGVFENHGNSFLILENENLQIRFILDRSQLFLDFHSKFDKKKDNWYSFDLIRQLFTEEENYHSIMDEQNGQFMQEHLEKILTLFKQETAENTLTKLKSLEKKRAKVLFG